MVTTMFFFTMDDYKPYFYPALCLLAQKNCEASHDNCVIMRTAAQQHSNTAANSGRHHTMARIRELQGGIYPPLPTFFQESEDLDLPTLQRHIRRISTSGIAGYVVMGTNGEAVHLSRDERVQVIETARETAGEGALILAG